MKKDPFVASGTCVDLAMFHWMYQNNKMSIWSIAELDAPLDINILAQAATVLLKQVPILTAYYKKGFRLGHWQQAMTIFKDDSWIHRCIVQRSFPTDKQASDAVDSVLSIPVSMKDPPSFKLTLISGSNNHYLVFQVHHAVTDGEGLKRICCVLAENYRNALTDSLPEQPVPFNMNRSWRQFYSSLTLKDLLFSIPVHSKELLNNIKFISALMRSRSVFNGNNDTEHTDAHYYQTVTLHESFVTTLRGTGITVNDLLMTGLLLTLYEWNSDSEGNAASIGTVYTADMRKWWGEPAGTFANMSVIRLLQVSENDLKSPASAYRSVSASIDRAKKKFGYRELWDFGVMSLYPHLAATLMGKLLHRLVKKISGLTNIGIIPDDAADFGNVRATSMSLLAPPLEAPCVVFTASGFQNRLTIHGIFCETHLSREKGREVMALFKTNLLHLLNVIPDNH